MKKQMFKNKLLVLCLLLSLAACSRKPNAPPPPQEHENGETAAKIEAKEHASNGVSGEGRAWTVTFASNGTPREMEVFAPAKDDGKRSLLILFHGYGDTAASFAKALDAQAIADKLRVIVAVPQGLTNAQDGKSSWNAGSCCAFGEEDRDDVALLDDIPTAITSILPFNAKIIDVAGFSNGGFFVEKLVCDHNDRIRGALNVGGGLPMNQDDCAPEETIRLVRVHGSEDTRVPFDGGEISEGRTILSFQESYAFWRSKLQCSRAPEMQQRGFATCRQQFDCPRGHMEFCEVLTLGHEWPKPRATGLDVFNTAWQVWERASND